MGVSLALISSFQWKKRSSKVSIRNRKRRRGDGCVASEIPLDILIEILTRLPAKSLMRFKCVSKLWYSLIRSRYFSNRYLTIESPPPRPRVYMSLVEHFQCDSMDVCHNPGESVLLSLSSSSSSSASSFNRDLTIPGMGGHSMVVLRGLMFYIVCTKACIYNPTTRQSVTLPAVKSNMVAKKGFRKRVFYFFGHDPVLDQYKVVCTVVIYSRRLKRITSEHWVLVLEAGGSWQRIECDQPHLPSRLGLCISGVIYYLASTTMSRDVVFSLDVRSEEFNMIQVPHVVSEYGESVGFIEYGGKPAIFDHTHLRESGLVDLWVLEDGGKWSTKSLVLQSCQMHLVNFSNIPLTVQGTTLNGEVILAPMPLVSTYYILYYDLQKNYLRKVKIKGIPDHRSEFYLRLMDNKIENIMHLET